MKWSGSVAYVTGASRGIGEATARRAQRSGATVGLIARSADDLERIARSLGDRVAVAAADVGDQGQVDAAVADLREQIGPPDILVNNAGSGSYRPFIEEDPATFDRLMRVNYFGVVHMTRAVIGTMHARGQGHIVNVASIAGRLGAPFESAYSASKFAVVGLTEALAAEVQGAGIRVSLVNPGPVRTQFTKARGVDFQRDRPQPLDPAVVAQAVLDAVAKNRFEQTRPRWLALPVAIRALTPTLYRRGLIKDFAKESGALANRARRD